MNLDEIRQFTELITDESIRKRYSVDASIFEVMPEAIAIPKGLEELQNLVRWTANQKNLGNQVSLSPRNGGTCMSGGSLTQDIMVDMNHGFSWVGQVDTDNNTTWVGSGTMHKVLADTVAVSELLFAPYTSSKDICGIGGMLGNNASGEKSIRYGATIDNVRRVRVVLHDGNEYEFGALNAEQLQEKLKLDGLEGDLYRGAVNLLEENWSLLWQSRPKVKKNAAGYQLWKVWDRDKTEFNLAKLFIGSQGTLGFITAAELQLIPIPKHTRMLVVPIPSLDKLAVAVQTIMMHHPEGVETYDKHTYELTKEHMPEIAAKAVVAAGQEMVIFAQFAEATKDATDHAEDMCERALKRLGYDVHTVKNDDEREAHWAIRRASFKLLKDHAHGDKRAVPFLEDTIVAIDHYGEFLAALQTILADYDMTYTYAGHIGDGSIRLIPLVNMEAPDAVETVFSLARRVYDLVFAFGGSMSVDHNDGLIRTAYLTRMYSPEVTAVFDKVKQLFDPFDIFNPGKKVRGSLEYSKAHMSRTNNPIF